MPIRTETRDRVGEIVLDHPPVNALDSAGWNELATIIERMGCDQAHRCLLIRGEGRGFCAGVDIKEMQKHPERIVDLNRGNYLSFRAVRATEVIPRGKGMAGLAWERDEIVSTCNLKTDETGDVRPGAKAVDAQAALAIPVRDGTGALRAVV